MATKAKRKAKCKAENGDLPKCIEEGHPSASENAIPSDGSARKLKEQSTDQSGNTFATLQAKCLVLPPGSEIDLKCAVGSEGTLHCIVQGISVEGNIAPPSDIDDEDEEERDDLDADMADDSDEDDAEDDEGGDSEDENLSDEDAE